MAELVRPSILQPTRLGRCRIRYDSSLRRNHDRARTTWGVTPDVRVSAARGCSLPPSTPRSRPTTQSRSTRPPPRTWQPLQRR